MNKALSALMTGVTLVATSLVALPVKAQGFGIGFFNACQTKTLRIAVSFRESSGGWVDRGMYTFAPGERASLRDVRTSNSIFYYYAESTDGSSVWTSSDQPTLTVGGRTYRPRRATANISSGTYYTTLTCTGEVPYLPPENSSEVVGERYEDMGGGWGGARATLYRNGLLVIEGRAVSNANTSATRTTVNVVGVDSRGRAIFVSRHLDIPTACGRLDTCSSDRSGRSDQNISPEIARYVSRLNIHISDRQGSSIYQNITRNITQACNSYDDLPVGVRAAIAAETGFPGCNPGRR